MKSGFLCRSEHLSRYGHSQYNADQAVGIQLKRLSLRISARSLDSRKFD